MNAELNTKTRRDLGGTPPVFGAKTGSVPTPGNLRRNGCAVVGLGLCAALLLAGCPTRKPQPKAEYKLAVPDFTLPALDGSNVTLSSLKGRPVVIDFWATWCPPCRMAVPELVKLHALYKERGITFMGVALNDNQDSVEKFVREKNVHYAMLLGDHSVAQDYQIKGIPTLYVIDAKGKIAFREEGFDPDSGLASMERVLKKLAGK